MLIYAQGGQWSRVESAEVTPITSFAPLTESSTMVWESERQLVGTIALDGDPRHATVLIDRQLRADGSIDQESKVFLHHVEVSGSSYQALYSCAPLKEWQQLQSWVADQPWHCAWVSIVRLAWSKVREDECVVLQSTNGLSLFAKAGSRIVFASVMSVDGSVGDLIYGAGSLGERVRDELMVGEHKASVALLRARWFNVSPGFSAQGVAQLQQAFADGSGLEVRAHDIGALKQEGRSQGAPPTALGGDDVHREPTLTSVPFDGDDSVTAGGALMALAAEPPISLLLNRPLEKLLLVAERQQKWITLGAQAAAVLILCLAGYSFYQGDRLDRLAAQAQAQVATLASSVVPSPAIDTRAAQAQLAFVETLGRLESGIDVSDALDAVRKAAGDGVRILSVRSDELGPKAASTSRTISVEGLIPPDATSTDSNVLGGFVRSLALSGYSAAPIESRGSTGGADVASRLFSYRLTRIDASPMKGKL